MRAPGAMIRRVSGFARACKSSPGIRRGRLRAKPPRALDAGPFAFGDQRSTINWAKQHQLTSLSRFKPSCSLIELVQPSHFGPSQTHAGSPTPPFAAHGCFAGSVLPRHGTRRRSPDGRPKSAASSDSSRERSGRAGPREASC